MVGGREPWRLGLGQRLEIELAPSAIETIRDEVWATRHDGLETGGNLLGCSWEDIISIAVAGTPGPQAIRQPNRLQPDPAHDELFEQVAVAFARAHGTDLGWVGEWHTHPRGGPAPSTQDLRAITRRRRLVGCERYVLLIATPSRQRHLRWRQPMIHANVLHEPGRRLICEPADWRAA